MRRAVLGAGVVVAIGLLAWWLWPGTPVPPADPAVATAPPADALVAAPAADAPPRMVEATEDAATTDAPDEMQAAVAAADPRPAPAGNAEPVDAGPPRLAVTITDTPGLAAPPDPGAPHFDLVRIAPDGSGVVAGRAAPGARVELRAGDRLLAEVEADASGAFAAFVEVPPAEGAQAVSLSAQAPGQGARLSAETLLITPPAPAPARVPAPVAAETAGAEPGDGARPAAPDGPMAPAAPLPDAASPRPAEAPAVVVAAPDGARLIQPGGAAPMADAAPVPIAIELISYTDAGAVEIAGRGRPGAQARLYLDNRAAAATPIGRDEVWRALLSGVAPGLYTLRADEIGAAGDVVSRIETPFQRVAAPPPRAVAPGVPGDAPAVRRAVAVTIQPGDTLWAISENRYGAGIRYVQVYRANRDRIRDPDLIYPGQVFDLPELAD
jgi:nucleoid-associated protein YgaU